MYPWFHLHHPGYAPIPPPPPPGASAAFADAGASTAGAAVRQHNVYVQGLDGFGRRRWSPRGPSRLKWFILGGIAAAAFLNHRHRSLRYGDEDDCDPRRYFFNCRKRREDLPDPTSDFKVTRNAPGHRDTSLEMEQDRQWRTSWHNRWNAHSASSKASPAASEAVNANIQTSSNPVDKASDSKSSPRSKNISQEHIKPNEELLTYDNATLGNRGSGQDSSQRARMESEAIAFAEEKIDLLVGLLEGLKSKLGESSQKR